jgi:hypothetical protein
MFTPHMTPQPTRQNDESAGYLAAAYINKASFSGRKRELLLCYGQQRTRQSGYLFEPQLKFVL